MYAFFERLVDPYPTADPGQPPKGFWAFTVFYSRPLFPWLITLAVLTAGISVVEISFFAYIGDLVDFVVARILDQLGFAQALLPPWGSDPPAGTD